MPTPEFLKDIQKFNDMYKMSSNDKPSIEGCKRLENFIDIMKEELEEGHDIVKKHKELEALDKSDASYTPKKLEVLTDLSDWLGDIIVYCASEARRWGIPLEKVLTIIMQSNFSKLDENGQPIYDHRGKVQKGPNYWKPEQKIELELKESVD